MIDLFGLVGFPILEVARAVLLSYGGEISLGKMKDDEEEGQGTRGEKGNRAGLTTFFRRKEKERKKMR